MADQGRRAFLRVAAATPLAAAGGAQAAQKAALDLTGIRHDGLAEQDFGPTPASDTPQGFKNFAKFLAAGGQREIKERADVVTALDPDIVVLNLPITTKVLWQRKRNYERELKRMESSFDRVVRMNGEYKWWG